MLQFDTGSTISKVILQSYPFHLSLILLGSHSAADHRGRPIVPIDRSRGLRLFAGMSDGRKKERLARPLLIGGLLGVLAALSCASAFGQVIEISPDGTIITHSGPATYSGPGQPSHPLSQPVTHRATVSATSAPQAAIALSAKNAGLSPALVEAVAWTESRMNQSARSAKGARGVMQLMPATARQMGVNPEQLEGNVEGGTRYLSGLLVRFDGDLINSLAGYNAGPEAVRQHGGIPPYRETKAYVSAIMDRLADTALKGDAR